MSVTSLILLFTFDSKDNHHRDTSATEKSIKIFKSNRLIHLFDIEILE